MVMERRCALGWLLLLLAAQQVAAFSDLVVFGDSLSDQGNTDAATLGVFPGFSYDNGRFSNGPVYTEHLASLLGLDPITRSGAGGNNFAFGGAETAGPGGFSGLFLNGLDEQVDEYTSEQEADPNALHIIWAGANDLLAEQLDFSIPAGNIASEINALHTGGARQFLVINLPDLGVTPRFNGDAIESADYTARTDSFNAELALAVAEVETMLAGSNVRLFDVNMVFDELIADPAAFGLTNTSDAFLNGSAGEASDYLFFDELHPTTNVHALLADEILALLNTIEGDFNSDGVVDAADFTVLRDSGLGLDALDTFQNAFGNTSSLPVATTSTQAVPEPAAVLLLLFGQVLWLSRDRQGAKRRTHTIAT